MNKAPFFSIIVPVYNVAPYLQECLESVLHQTFEDWECLCVDDGSTDASGEILDTYARQDARFKIVHQPNAGVSVARNRALDLAEGRYICFLDGDDRYSLVLLQIAFEQFQRKKIDTFYMGRTRTFSNLVQDNLTAVEVNCHDVVWNIDDIHMFSASVSRHIWNRLLINDVRFLKYPIGEDCLFCLQVAQKVKTVGITTTPLYFYRDNPMSALHVKCNITRLRAIMEANFCKVKILTSGQWKTRNIPLKIKQEVQASCWTPCGRLLFRFSIKDLYQIRDIWQMSLVYVNKSWPFRGFYATLFILLECVHFNIYLLYVIAFNLKIFQRIIAMFNRK